MRGEASSPRSPDAARGGSCAATPATATCRGFWVRGDRRHRLGAAPDACSGGRGMRGRLATATCRAAAARNDALIAPLGRPLAAPGPRRSKRTQVQDPRPPSGLRALVRGAREGKRRIGTDPARSIPSTAPSSAVRRPRRDGMTSGGPCSAPAAAWRCGCPSGAELRRPGVRLSSPIAAEGGVPRRQTRLARGHPCVYDL